MADSQLLRLLKSLRTRVDAGAQIRWERHGDSSFILRLPQLTLRLTPREQEKGKPAGVNVVVTVPDINLKSRSPIFDGDEGYDDVEALLKSARGKAADLEALLGEGAEYIESAKGEIGLASPPAPPSPPPVPARPSGDQAADFFRRIAGNWHLDFERGQEHVSIDKNGNYFILLKHGKEVVGQEIRPKFRLVLLSCDAEGKNVEVSKEELNGRVRQIEVLQVNESEMTGFAKHDEHRLIYRRQK